MPRMHTAAVGGWMPNEFCDGVPTKEADSERVLKSPTKLTIVILPL